MRADLQADCYALEIINGDVALTAFYAAKISSVHVDIIREVLLAETEGFSVAANVRCDDSP